MGIPFALPCRDSVSEITIKKCFHNYCGQSSEESEEDGDEGPQGSCVDLLAAAQTSSIDISMTVEEFVSLDENIATESMEDWEEALVIPILKRWMINQTMNKRMMRMKMSLFCLHLH